MPLGSVRLCERRRSGRSRPRLEGLMRLLRLARPSRLCDPLFHCAGARCSALARRRKVPLPRCSSARSTLLELQPNKLCWLGSRRNVTVARKHAVFVLCHSGALAHVRTTGTAERTKWCRRMVPLLQPGDRLARMLYLSQARIRRTRFNSTSLVRRPRRGKVRLARPTELQHRLDPRSRPKLCSIIRNNSSRLRKLTSGTGRRSSRNKQANSSSPNGSCLRSVGTRTEPRRSRKSEDPQRWFIRRRRIRCRPLSAPHVSILRTVRLRRRPWGCRASPSRMNSEKTVPARREPPPPPPVANGAEDRTRQPRSQALMGSGYVNFRHLHIVSLA